MKTYQVIIRKQGEFFKETMITAFSSLDAINAVAKAEKLPVFEMRGIDGVIKWYISPIYDFEARGMGMVLS